MILLLADERVVRVAEVEPLVRVHPVMRHRQLLEIVVAEHVPGCLLKGVESDALVAGVDVTVVRHLVAVENGAAAAAAVLHCAQLRFLRGRGQWWRGKKTAEGVCICSIAGSQLNVSIGIIDVSSEYILLVAPASREQDRPGWAFSSWGRIAGTSTRYWCYQGYARVAEARGFGQSAAAIGYSALLARGGTSILNGSVTSGPRRKPKSLARMVANLQRSSLDSLGDGEAYLGELPFDLKAGKDSCATRFFW